MIRLSKNVNEDSSYAAQLAKARQNMQEISEELTKLHSRQISFHERSTADLAVKKILEAKNTLRGIQEHFQLIFLR